MPDLDLVRELLGWFFFLFSACIGNPTPEELIIVAAGIRASTLGRYGIWVWLLLPTVILGSVAADFVLYWIGRLFGPLLDRWRWSRGLAPPEKRERIRANLARYGPIIFVVGRLIPGIRTTLFLTAGTTRLSVIQFMTADFIGALVGNSLIFFLAYFIGDQFKEFLERLEAEALLYRPILILTGLGAVAAYLLFVFFRRPFPTGDPEEIPLIGKQVASHLPTSETVVEPGPSADQPSGPVGLEAEVTKEAG